MGNFVERIGEFVIHTAQRIRDFIKLIFSNKHFRRYAPLALVLIIAIITFATCAPWSDPEPEPEPEPTVITTPPPTYSPRPPVTAPPSPVTAPPTDPEPDPEPVYTGPVNPLTGAPVEEDVSGNRPVAIMINNHRQAQPLLGISKADILYEMPVEGGITRMMALFQDVTDVGTIGSVRSSRPYYVDVAQSFDAVYVFAGGSPQAYSILSSRNITRADGVNGPHSEIFYRDPARQHMSYEHRLVTSGARIIENFPKYNNFRLEHADGYERALSFVEDGTPEDGVTAKMDFEIRFTSGSKTTSFSYNTEDTLYYLSQYGSTCKDGNDGTAVAFTNVLILQTSISGIPGDKEGRLRMTTTGDGSGYFICGGKYIEIGWSRKDDSSQFEYSRKDGSELILGQGKTYICIVSSALEVELS